MSLAGTRVADHYTLLRPLGQGASSRVYLAVGDDGKAYTVKLFAAGLGAHAEREASMRVRAPHLAEVVAQGEVAGQPAVVLRFSRGQELFSRYRARPAVTHERRAYLRTLSDVLEALAAMHAGGWLHRDVKADNILVQPSGEAHLLDYDLSGPLYETFDAPLRIGTAAFQSPEARLGSALGPQSDLYSVGVLLYWGLCGALPDSPQPHFSAGPLGALCRRLLNCDPATRPGDAAEVRRELLALGLD